MAAALSMSMIAGCSSAPPITELVVVVSADIPIPNLHVTVLGPDGMMRVDQHVLAPVLPISIVLTRDGAPYGPVSVHVDGGDAASDTITELVAGQRRRLDVFLSSSCRCTPCSATETCHNGACVDRHVAGATLPAWASGTDASVGVPHDAGAPIDSGSMTDAGPSGGCGCMGEGCCAGACHGTLTCLTARCQDCSNTTPTIMGSTPASTVFLRAVSATFPPGDTLFVSVTDAAMTTNQIPFRLGGGVTANGSVLPSMRVVGMAGTGSTIIVTGVGASTGHIDVVGATVTGSFSAPRHTDGTEGSLTSASASGNTLTLRAWDGSTGTLVFNTAVTCR